jgi:hypothetical protein
LLREDQHVAVGVAERLLVHRGVGEVHVDRQAFMQGRVAIPRNRLQSIDEVHFLVIRRQAERVPCELGGADMHFGIQWQEARFELYVVSYSQSWKQCSKKKIHVRQDCRVSA